MDRPRGNRGRATRSRTWKAHRYRPATCGLLAGRLAIASLRRSIRPRHRFPLHGTLQRTNAYPFRTRASLARDPRLVERLHAAPASSKREKQVSRVLRIDEVDQPRAFLRGLPRTPTFRYFPGLFRQRKILCAEKPRGNQKLGSLS